MAQLSTSSGAESSSTDAMAKIMTWLQQSMKEQEAAKADESQNTALQAMFRAMADKSNTVPCTETGTNIFKGLGLVDESGGLASGSGSIGHSSIGTSKKTT